MTSTSGVDLIVCVSVKSQVQSVTTPVSRLIDSLHKAEHVKEVTECLTVTVTHILEMRIKVTSNDNTVLVI